MVPSARNNIYSYTGTQFLNFRKGWEFIHQFSDYLDSASKSWFIWVVNKGLLKAG
jgi:hypothetical protein